MTAMCICTWRWTGTEWVRVQVAGCDPHPAGTVLEEIRRSLADLNRKADHIMTALDNLKAADQSLKDEVVTFLADISARLAAEDPDIQAVADDVNAQVAALQGADPASPVTGGAASS